MNGFFLIIPFILIRFGLLARFSSEAVKRAAHFAPLSGNEVFAYWVYQISNAAIFVYLCFLRVKPEVSWQFFSGAAVYLLGLALCAATIKDFASPSEGGINQNGLYRFSRNPMYLSYFLYFIGCVILTRSVILCVIVVLFQIVSHWIILSEERWCMNTFGDAYRQYMKTVRRYI
ncbi:methyltransferase family protein [Hungatella sp.]|uniref:methyltransferase family protein n=2 Tax=Hungatella sp. TaxID=2613924 RepID=UPI003992CD27